MAPSSTAPRRRGGRRVAIVHYWLVAMRGGEKVVEELCRMYPEADIFTLVCDRDKLSDTLKRHEIRTSFLQRIPGARKHYTKFLPLMPFALEHLDLQDYDLVISSESGPAKGIITRPDALHICYCHSPMRYIWDQFHLYRQELGFAGRMMMTLAGPPLRAWDVTTSARVDAFVANSAHVGRRIRRFYNRDSSVIHPPVAVDDFVQGSGPGEFYLYAGQLTAYKRADIAVKACSESRRPLVVIGEGEQTERLKAMAGPTVTFLGRQPFDVLKDHLSRCKALLFPGVEDFGILPVEAMASGRPVIAYAEGGVCETVTSPDVGLWFQEQTTESLLGALSDFESIEHRMDPATIRRHAQSFSTDVFRRTMGDFIETRWARHVAGSSAGHGAGA
ncbi:MULTISPECIES: glycosyltransferase [unclassified Aureimonas]|uniref:glycosyltransferase n=1 Tax=unclassified Aureimonas TaxID=2615206 RepID=UPI000700B124|nr:MULTISPECIES: glycosyltransferase [unclassified Aureimonas]KQT60473.1 glycosyl transferase [Aureimonas sp. Leaf427]KQT79350.1 glycosyl transferase [Aureimonas sp. Leaf460]